MSIEKTLNVQKRDARGKGANGRLRSKDMVPGWQVRGLTGLQSHKDWKLWIICILLLPRR